MEIQSESSETQVEQSTGIRPLRTAAKKLTLTLDEQVDLSSVVASLQDLDCAVLYLNIYRSFIQKYPFQKISAAFFYARLPNLMGIKVECPELKTHRPYLPSSTFSFPVKALTCILQKALHLEYLIFDLKLAGTRVDFENFGKAVGKMQSVQCVGFTINVEDLTAEPQDADQPNLLDPLIYALSKKKSLTDVIIKGGVANPMEASLGALCSNSLRDLCQLPKLSCLYLFLFVLSDDNVSSMARALEGNHVLKEACINCSISCSGSQALSRMLRLNKSLREVILIISQYGSNTNTERVEEEIAKGLACSSSLQEFLFQGGSGEISLKSLQLFRNLLLSNYVLEKICLRMGASQAHRDLEKEMKFYLELNKTGRGKLLKDNTVFRDQRWIQMLARSQDNLPNLHYFMAMNPSLCNPALPQSSCSSPSSTSRCANSPRKRKRLYRAAKYKGVNYC